jgi:hypothetical protein
MAKQSKNKVKLNKEYEHLGTFTKSALAAIRQYFDVPDGANKIRANMTNTLKHNEKHFSQIEKYLEQLVLTKEGYVRYIVANFNQIRLGSQPKSLVLVVTDSSTNHIAALHLVFDKNENFWLVKSIRIDRNEDMERKKLVWTRQKK